jgi:hypothetical protein
MSAPAQVALVVIARDEAPRIQRLLHSVAPWVDTMWVLDTGSGDETPALAAACGARVERFTWCDDFAAARNAALALAAADWHLVLDADEWLMDGGPALRALRDTPRSFVGSVELVDHFFDGQARSAHLRLSRLLPGTVRYRGRVHEQPEHCMPVRPWAVRIGHDGYLPDRLHAKRGRNRRLLQQALVDAPEDAYAWYQLGKDAAVYDEHALAEQAFERAASLHPPRPWLVDGPGDKAPLHPEAPTAACARAGAGRDRDDQLRALSGLLLRTGRSPARLGGRAAGAGRAAAADDRAGLATLPGVG